MRLIRCLVSIRSIKFFPWLFGNVGKLRVANTTLFLEDGLPDHWYREQDVKL
ncbi:hypothetical protein PPEP_b0956 [Pseudoalteromonas peptidolytica F12-50-A1]|uniref:Uncharacterized protein n=1 Tax=Pseudoalteromonas peptidolytica F12-50-A1 TaxID=1315280 RepID=A0A8I0N0U3_9GAMM|nr:hypothetical protein [Pseudoalteromonas peptidolytica F12-50-A1]